MLQTRGLQQFLQRMQRVPVEIATRSALSGTTTARWRTGSCVATPVGQRSVWRFCACTQPSANMKPRAELHQSAPIASVRATPKGRHQLAAGADADLVAQVHAEQRVVHQQQAFLQRRADMVDELERRRVERLRHRPPR